MDSKKMNTLNWMFLFVLFILVPGSTLNVIESTAATTMKSFVSTPIPTTTATTTTVMNTFSTIIKTKTSVPTLRQNIKRNEEESFATTTPTLPTPLTSYNATNAFNIHSISSKGAGFVMVEPEIKAKSSIIELTKAEEEVKEAAGGEVNKVPEEEEVIEKAEGASSMATEVPLDVGNPKFSTKVSINLKRTETSTSQTDFLEAKVTKAAAAVAATAVTTTTLATTKVHATTKRTKVSLSHTKAVGKKNKKKHKHEESKGTGERDENDGSRFDSMDVKSTAAVGEATPATRVSSTSTPTAAATATTTTTTPITISIAEAEFNSTKGEVTTKESVTKTEAAATIAITTTTTTAQLLDPTLLASTPNEVYLQQKHQNISKGNYTFRPESNNENASSNNNNSTNNYGENKGYFQVEINKNNSKSGIITNGKNISSVYEQGLWAQQQQKQKQEDQHAHPLQRPKIQKSNIDAPSNGTSNSTNNNKNNMNNQNYNNNNYGHLYHSNNNYFSNQQNAPIDMLEQQQLPPPAELRPQYARQVQHQAQQKQLNQHYHLAAMMPLATTSPTAAIFSAIDNNLIKDKYSKQNERTANLNKSMPRKSDNTNTQQQRESEHKNADNVAQSTKTNSGSGSGSGSGSVSLREFGMVMNVATNVSAFPTVTTTTIKSTTRRPPPTTTPRPTPSIDDYQTIISQAGTHAYLPCNVKQLVKKPISWLRVRDGHILTVDQTTFIADQRFQSIFAPNPERWSLQIKYVQLKDEGTYECQVSTEPKSSAIVTLRVVEPRTELIGEPTRHVKAGSQVKLRCIISQALEPPVFINWFHNQKQIYLHSRKGWRTEIERIELPMTESPITTTSTTTTTTTTKTFTPTTSALPTTDKFEGAATTNTAQADAEGAAEATGIATSDAIIKTTTTKPAPLLANSFDSYRDTLKGETNNNNNNNTPLAQGVATVSDRGMTTTTTMSLISTPTTAMVSSGFGSGNNNTSPILAAMAAAAATAVNVSTALPTITKTMRWPTTTSTTSTTLAAVEVRQITTASLIIPSVEKQDSGNYTCSPSNSAPKTVVLHVLNGEYSASAITSGVSGNAVKGDCSRWCCMLLPLLLQSWHQKLTVFFIIMKMTLSVGRQRFSTLLRLQRSMNHKSAGTTTKIDNVAAPINSHSTNLRCISGNSKCSSIYFFVGDTSRQSIHCTCQHGNGWSHDNKNNKRITLIVNSARILKDNEREEQGCNHTNCYDKCRDVSWRTEEAQRLMATKEKT